MTSLVLSLKMGKIYRLLAAWNFGISIRERERERKDRCPRNYPSAVCNSMTGIGACIDVTTTPRSKPFVGSSIDKKKVVNVFLRSLLVEFD